MDTVASVEGDTENDGEALALGLDEDVAVAIGEFVPRSCTAPAKPPSTPTAGPDAPPTPDESPQAAPFLQGRQLLRPEEGWYLPIGQRMQMSCPARF